NRTLEAEQGLLRWLQLHADHSRAFELATEAWNEPLPRGIHRRREPPRRDTRLVLTAMAAAMALVVWSAFLYFRPSDVKTGVGEQRLIVLEDRSRVMLNTATRILVRYDAHERHIDLESGEALFEVAPQSGRPFVVTAGERSVKALGTSFAVRREADQVAV